MAGPRLTPAQLRSHVAEVRRKSPGARVIGLQATGWEGGDRIECDGEPWAVVCAGSPLAVRAALRAAETSPVPTIVLTPANEVDLGLDARARLARNRLLVPDVWESVASLFRARDVDPVARVPALGRALLEHAPAEGYPPAPTGLLDAATAWRCAFRCALEIRGSDPADDPTEVDLVVWALSDRAAGRWAALPPEFHAAARDRLAAVRGPAAVLALDTVACGAGADAVALGLALEVVCAEDPLTVELAAAAARLERFQGDRPVSLGVARRYARTSGEALARLSDEAADRHRRRADALLAEVQATAALHRGTHTQGAWEARLARFATTLTGLAVSGPVPQALAEACRARLRELEMHTLRTTRAEEYARAEAAVRLVAWLASAPRVPTDSAALAGAYRDDLSFVDRARDRLGSGEPGADLSTGYRALEQAVATAREEFDRRFAAAVVADSVPGAIEVERVIGTVLAPRIAAGHRALLVVLDGLSWAVAHELLPDLARHGWQEHTWLASGEPPPPVLAAIPSATEFSRASLFCGRVARGDAGTERNGFATHPELAPVCDRKFPPVLFHKAALADGAHGAVAEALRAEKVRAVAVVVNAIDDQLAGAEQVRECWTVDSIRPLGALLQAARDSGRLVLLTGDHGHVWHRNRARYRKAADAGERWRPPVGEPDPGEVLVQGPRVQDGRGGDAVIVPWVEELRYGTAKKGYHGGVTPREMLVPLVVLTHTSNPTGPGLEPCRLGAPEWWELAPLVRPTPVPRRTSGSLFDLLAEPTQADFHRAPIVDDDGAWLDRLLASEVYRHLSATTGELGPTDDEVRRSLTALAAAGGALTLSGFARQVGIPLARLDGYLTKLQRLLNGDHETVRVDRTQNRVFLDLALLADEFELD